MSSHTRDQAYHLDQQAPTESVAEISNEISSLVVAARESKRSSSLRCPEIWQRSSYPGNPDLSYLQCSSMPKR